MNKKKLLKPLTIIGLVLVSVSVISTKINPSPSIYRLK